ncbi:cellulose biosynthesis protein BcsG [Photobacterium damselae]
MSKVEKIVIGTKISGLGWWNVYFIIKIALYLKGVINFHPLENFSLLFFLLLPLEGKFHAIRNIIAIPLALWLLHYDSYLPPLERLWSQIGQLMSFELSYLFELIGRFISFRSLVAFFVLCSGYYLLNKFLRVTVFVIIALISISIKSWMPITNTEMANINDTVEPQHIHSSTVYQPTTSIQITEINDNVLNKLENKQFEEEASRRVIFNPQAKHDAPFDLLFLSICSVAWDDIKIAGLANHPLFKEFDVMFDNFSSATSYSGPAVIRLLRANCGQERHNQLFKPAPSQQCYLFENLKKLGFNENLLMNHDGVFDSFLELIKKEGDLQTHLISQKGFTPYQKAFDGSYIYRDKQVLDKWWQQRINNDSNKVVALYNTISLHDGNRIIGNDPATSLDSYRQRLQNLLDDLYAFFKKLQASKRNIVVALVPEHGAGMRGDKMQISGMREIPAATIIHTPVALKIFGSGLKRIGEPTHVKGPSSYLALSQLVSNILDENVYQSKQYDPTKLIQNLPTTPVMAQNSGSTVMKVNGKYYVSLDSSTWSEYPSN